LTEPFEAGQIVMEFRNGMLGGCVPGKLALLYLSAVFGSYSIKESNIL
jgi:hypothetical protein